MNDCRSIEPLLYLCREGELSDDDQTKVFEHTQHCSVCRDILQQLLSMDNVLAEVRVSIAEPVDAMLVNEVIDLLSKRHPTKMVRDRILSALDDILDWLHPAVSVTLFLSAVLFVVQISRDAVKVADMERSLQAHGRNATSMLSFIDADRSRLLALASSEEGKRSPFSSGVRDAAMISDPTDLIGSGLRNLFANHTGLFEDLARKYPDLSAITLQDGLDERERKILATEGKSFLREFEQLVGEGEK